MTNSHNNQSKLTKFKINQMLSSFIMTPVP